jgi:hypothetical protein
LPSGWSATALAPEALLISVVTMPPEPKLISSAPGVAPADPTARAIAPASDPSATTTAPVVDGFRAASL